MAIENEIVLELDEEEYKKFVEDMNEVDPAYLELIEELKKLGHKEDI